MEDTGFGVEIKDEGPVAGLKIGKRKTALAASASDAVPRRCGRCSRGAIERPDAVVSTGAAPGCFAIIFGRLLGCRTVWLDSVANVEQMSMSGNMVRRYSQLWLTQWPHLAAEDGPEYAGKVF